MTGGGLNIGKLFGIQVSIDWSWFFIFLLVIWNLGTAFTSWHPDWTPALSWGLAVVASLLFFASVLAHELAHSLVANARGLPVRRITLFLFGGVSDLQREPPSAGTEFVMAIVGPLTSLVLGGIFLGLGILDAHATPTTTGGLARLSPLATVLLWLGPINLILGVFNLVPGFPLDGGRVLRSILWAATGNLRVATRWASWVGEVIAWLMILGGVAMIFGAQIPVFGTGLVGGVWLALIGWFLHHAAQQSYQQVAIHEILGGVPVAALMQRDVATVDAGSSVAALVHDRMMQTDQHSFPVVRDGALVGIVGVDDVRRVPRDRWETTTVEEMMTPAPRLATATPEEDAADALDELASRDVDQLPVVQDGRLVGLLRRADIVRWLQLHPERA